jgi:hypothetical protein
MNFFRKSCRLSHNAEKYGTAGEATDGNTIRRMRFARWITKATDTHRPICNTYCFSTAPQRYFIRTMLVLCNYHSQLILQFDAK